MMEKKIINLDKMAMGESDSNRIARKEKEELLEGLFAAMLLSELKNAVKDKSKEKSEEEDEGFIEFLNKIKSDIDQKEAAKKECEIKRPVFEKKDCETYSFTEIIREWERGYEGEFEFKNTLFSYDHDEKEILMSDMNGRNKRSAYISTMLLNGKFTKHNTSIKNGEALEMAMQGKTVRFEVEFGCEKYTGTLTMKNNLPHYTVDSGNIKMNDCILITALMKGKWFIK